MRLRQLRGGLPVGAGLGEGEAVPELPGSRVSSCWVRMPSAMEWATPCFQPSSRASLMVAPSP